MQAIRVAERKPPELRWLQPLALLGALAFLFTCVVTVRSPGVPGSVERPSVVFLAPPSGPAQDWLPVRVPVRTNVTRDPAPMAVSPPPFDEAQAIGPSLAERTTTGVVAGVAIARPK